jgi:excisionase family DNA binding protein
VQKLLVSVKVAADLAGVSRSTAYAMIASGEWTHVRIGERATGVRVVLADLVTWVEKRKQHGTRSQVPLDGLAKEYPTAESDSQQTKMLP